MIELLNMLHSGVLVTPATLGPHELNLSDFDRALDGAGWLGRLLTNPMFWGLLLAAIGSFILSGVLLHRRNSDLATHGPTWRRLAASMQLSAQQRRMLKQLGKVGGHINPAPLVISCGCFDRAVHRRYHNQHPENIQTLRTHLFG